MEKTVVLRRADRLLVPVHRLQLPTFDAQGLRDDQLVLVRKRRRTVRRPLPQLRRMRVQALTPRVTPAFEQPTVPRRCNRKRTKVVIREKLDLAGRTKEKIGRAIASVDGDALVAGQNTGFQFDDRVPAHQCSCTIVIEVTFEGLLVEAVPAERRERYRSALHIQHEALLEGNDVDDVLIIRSPCKFDSPKCFLPDLFKGIAAQQQIGHRVIAAVTGKHQIARFDTRSKANFQITQRLSNGLRPYGRNFHRKIDPRSVSREIIFLHESARKLAKTVAFGVPVVDMAEKYPEP
ncbi:conserved hypothetical protein [Ricinus communis]|uniref:Uncharacterized protein n=1 Tax=Ricinus communis TaxID=3988 RepID=B9T932_RICCO|nr:conserved hypothetical protein [Ricinus communis]